LKIDSIEFVALDGVRILELAKEARGQTLSDTVDLGAHCT
jgi:hypothetical protein